MMGRLVPEETLVLKEIQVLLDQLVKGDSLDLVVSVMIKKFYSIK
jgi:hypothetical protein